MNKIFKSILIWMTLTPLFLTSCGSTSTNSSGTLNVLASTSILADITQNVVGDRAKVTYLIPIDADPHEYQAAPSDVTKVARSTVLVVNGLNYETFIQPLLDNAGGQRLVITASAGLPTHQMNNGSGVVIDPHMWLDANRVITYVENIRAGLTKADPSGAATYTANAEAYIAQLKNLDAWITEQASQLPADKRLLVTNHESLGYFADRYGFTVVGAVIPHVSTDAAPSAQQMAGLIDQIKSSGAPAIFLSHVESTKLADQVASDTGVKVVNDLNLESLTNGAPADTYINMMKHNVMSIVAALK